MSKELQPCTARNHSECKEENNKISTTAYDLLEFDITQLIKYIFFNVQSVSINMIGCIQLHARGNNRDIILMLQEAKTGDQPQLFLP